EHPLHDPPDERLELAGQFIARAVLAREVEAHPRRTIIGRAITLKHGWSPNGFLRVNRRKGIMPDPAPLDHPFLLPPPNAPFRLPPGRGGRSVKAESDARRTS